MREFTVLPPAPDKPASPGSVTIIPSSAQPLAPAATSQSTGLLRLDVGYRPQQVLAATAPEGNTSVPIVAVNSRPGGEGPVLSGLDVLEKEGFDRLKGRKIGLLVNHSSINREGTHLLDLIHGNPRIRVEKIFSPEHGLFGDVDTKTADFVETRTGIMVHSLYSNRKEPGVKPHYPREGDVKGLDAVVVDMQDIGARFYTYAAYMAFMMETCAKLGVEVIVLDRPNPIGGLYVDGPLTDRDLLGRATSYMEMPVAHGMTMGEMAGMFNEVNKIGCKLTVVKCRNWKRGMLHDKTGLRWVNPSPNIQDLDAAIAYPGIGMTERIVSMGRGTTEPFHIVGAPWIQDAVALADALNTETLHGVRFEPIEFRPTGTYARWHVGENKLCRGVRIVITDREKFDAVDVGVHLMVWLHANYGNKAMVQPGGKAGLVYDVTKVRASCSALLCVQVAEGKTPAEIIEFMDSEVARFREIRKKHLLYPE